MTCDISASGRAVRHGRHLKAGIKHQRPLLVNTYVSDLLIEVKSWHTDILAYTSDSACRSRKASELQEDGDQI